MATAAVVLLLTVANVVHGFRDAYGTGARHDQTRWFGNCKSNKCNNQSHKLRGDLKGTLQFQDCRVKEAFEQDGEKMCEETCTVLVSKVAKQVKVVRKSGHGEQECKLPLQEGICEDRCCVAKCSGKSYEFQGSRKGKKYEYQDCQIKKKSLYLPGESNFWCEEMCKFQGFPEMEAFSVIRQSESTEVEKDSVLHQSNSADLQCQPEGPPVQDMAMDFMQQLENKALTLTHGEYKELPMMKAWKITKFLQSISSYVLQPEMENAGGNGYSRQISKEARHVAILGDLHGQLWNLLAYLGKIKKEFKDEGLKDLDGSGLLFCDPKMQYVFMGDYVDRGERGVELLLLLLSYKALCPDSMILLLGNHEQEPMWGVYGFEKELHYKFSRQISTSTVAAVTQLLPYVVVAPTRWMAIHGGISKDMVRLCSGKGGDFSDCLTREVGDTTVWADPHEQTGWLPSSRGPGVFKFGMDIAKSFLESNNLKGIFRGHEQVNKGYSEIRENDYFVATVFSAADYVGVFCEGRIPRFDRQLFSGKGVGNKGAFVLEELTSAELSSNSSRDSLLGPFRGKSSPKKSEDSDFQIIRMSAKETRALAGKFTGAQCPSWSLLETRNASLESFMQENHRLLGADGPGDCSLGKEEAVEHEEEVHALLSASCDPEFEARKLIDLQGEDLINGEAVELCKSMKKDQITLRVYKELHGPDEKILENDMETRKEELE